jgi:hypothetical protein
VHRPISHTTSPVEGSASQETKKPSTSLWQEMQWGVFQHVPFLAKHLPECSTSHTVDVRTVETIISGARIGRQYLGVEWLRGLIRSSKKYQVGQICCRKNVSVVEFLLLHLCASNRYNVGLEALTVDPRPKCFSMLLDGHTVVGILNELLHTAPCKAGPTSFLKLVRG